MRIWNTACSRLEVWRISSVSDRKPLQPDEDTNETVVWLLYQYRKGPKYVKPAQKRLDSDLPWYHSSVRNDHLLIELLAKKHTPFLNADYSQGLALNPIRLTEISRLSKVPFFTLAKHELITNENEDVHLCQVKNDRSGWWWLNFAGMEKKIVSHEKYMKKI